MPFSRSVIECFSPSVHQALDSPLKLQDKSLFASFKSWSDLVMVGQSKLMPGQMPGSGYASATDPVTYYNNTMSNCSVHFIIIICKFSTTSADSIKISFPLLRQVLRGSLRKEI